MIVTSHMFEGNHTPFVKKIDEIAYFAAYWIILGIASSIGLGTGLHTFVLYTGPHIAKVTMVANECNDAPDYLPSRWTINPTFGECKPGNREQISFWTILFMTQLEGILWGFGTAIGELPPYFVAKAAALAGKKDEELQELESGGANSMIDKVKLIIYKNLQKYGWLTILLSASIPNPLFDLAGITCGHFGIPFKTFFSATVIGKAIIKVHLQMFFVIFLFSHHHVENVLNLVESSFPFLKHSLSEMLQKQKKLLHTPEVTEGQKPIIAQIWDVFILLMILFFAVSIINSLANQYLEEEREAQNKSPKKKEIELTTPLRKHNIPVPESPRKRIETDPSREDSETSEEQGAIRLSTEPAGGDIRRKDKKPKKKSKKNYKVL